jgi:hypothetical protein
MIPNANEQSRKFYAARLALILAAALFLVACATTRPISRYTEAANQFKSAVTSASDVVKKSIAEDSRVQRQSAIRYYLDVGPSKENLDASVEDASVVEASFANFACAGTRGVRAHANLRYLEKYGKVLAGVLKEPADGVLAVAANIEELRKPKAPLELPEPKDDQFARCLTGVENTLKVKGLPLNPSGDGDKVRFGFPASVVAFQEAIKAIAKVLEGVLKIAEEAERKDAFERIVKVNEPNVKMVLADQSLNDSLNSAVQQRRLVSLYGPFLRFERLMRLDRSDRAKHPEIWREALRTHEELAEFDAIRLSVEPVDITKAVTTAHESLVALAHGKASIEDTLAYLKALADQLEEIKKDMDDAETKIDKAS